MNYKTISGAKPAGYTVPAGYSLDITNNGSVGGTGVFLTSAGVVNNDGKVVANNTAGVIGVYLHQGGEVFNQSGANIYASTGVISSSGVPTLGTVANYGSIGGARYGVHFYEGGEVLNGAGGTIFGVVYAVDIVAAGSVTNFGVIDELVGAGGFGVLLTDGGSVTNGSAASQSALIEGYAAVTVNTGAGTVSNFGTIASLGVTSPTLPGVSLDGGGGVINGAVNDTGALIKGQSGIVIGTLGGAGTLVNYGAVDGLTGSAAELADGGSITNGSATDHVAVIAGLEGVVDINVASTVANFGTIQSLDRTDAAAFLTGGKLTNGAGGDTAALIIGARGVEVESGAGAVVNYAAITGEAGGGVRLDFGGSVANGGGADRSASITGLYGIQIDGGSGSVTNSGTIQATGGAGDYGVGISNGGRLTNGSATNRTALIAGYNGLFLDGVGQNFATILGQGDIAGVGVDLTAGALVNGTATHTGAVIEGYTGVDASNVATVTNFGTIIGDGGTAVQFKSAGNELVVEAGSVFVGSVLGNGGTLVLGDGVGTVTGLFTAPGVTVSGSMTPTTFQSFNTVAIAPGAAFTVADSPTVGAGEALVDSGSLSVAGTLTLTTGGSLSTTGTLSGAGTLALAGGAATFGAGTSLTIANVTVSNFASIASVAASLTYAGKWTQSAGTLTVAGGDTVTFTGTADSFAGTLAGAGTVALASGADTLAGTTLAAAGVTITGATVTLAGTIAISHQVTAGDPHLIIAAGGATLSGGTFNLTGSAANAIIGATATATLTVKDTFLGAGQLGDGRMILVNDGVIAGDDPVALTLNTGAEAIVNAGTIEATRAGGLATIVSAVDNTGVLAAVSGGVLTVDGAVTGSGIGEVGTGTLKFAAASTFNQNVTFTSGSTGTLELAHGQTYSGTITGLSTTAANALDLDDIPFVSGTTTATFAGTASGGTLTVKDGGLVASIKLTGDYLGSTFVTSLGAGGVGTRIVDPPRTGGAHVQDPMMPTHVFVQAMAGMGAVAAVTPWRVPAERASPAGMALFKPA